MEHTRRARARSVAPNGWLGQSAFGIAERLGEGGKEKRTQRIATGVMVMGILLPLLVASVGVTAWAVANDVGSRERNRGSFPAEMTEFFGGRRTSPQKRSDIFNFDDPSSSFSSFFDLDENPFTNDDAEEFRGESSISSRTSTYPSKHPPPPNPRSSSSTVNDRSHYFGPTSFSSSSPSFSRHPSSHSNSYKNTESSSQQYGQRSFSQSNSANFQDQQQMHSNSDKTESEGNYKNTSASSPNQIVVGPFHVTVVDSKSPLLASLGLNQLQKTPEKSSSSSTSKQSNYPLSSNSPPSLISAASTRSSPSYTEYPRYREHHNIKQHISPNNFEYGRYKDFKHNDEQGRYQDDFSSSEEDSSQLSQEEPRNPYDSPEYLQRLPQPKPHPHSSGPPPSSGEPYNTRNYGSIIDLSTNARNPSKLPNTRPPHGEENPHHSHNGPSNTWQPHPQHQNNPPPYNRETQHSGPLYPYHPPPLSSKPPSYPPSNERPENQPQSSPSPPNKASPPSSHYPPSHYSKPGTYPSQESRYSTSSSGHPPPPHYHPPHHSTSSSTSSSSYGGSPTTKTSSRTGSVSYGSHHHGHYHPPPSKPKITLSFKARPPSGSSHFHTSIGHGGGGGLSIPISVNPIDVMKKLVNPLAILNPLANKKVTIGITIEQKNDHPPLSISHGGY